MRQRHNQPVAVGGQRGAQAQAGTSLQISRSSPCFSGGASLLSVVYDVCVNMPIFSGEAGVAPLALVCEV